jgi:hypothetical protein
MTPHCRLLGAFFPGSSARPRFLGALRPAALAAAVLLAPAYRATAQLPPGGDPEPAPETAPYEVLDQVGGSWVNLATFPVRPMVFDPARRLWAVNHHDSKVERFVSTSSTPDKVYGVPWSPVAIAWWNGNGVLPAELLVVCRGTWAVIGLDPNTGAMKRVLQLRPGSTLPGGIDTRIGRMAEPADILVDDVNERAFVSCTGADSVVQIDLVANQIVRVFNEEADPKDAGNPSDTAWFRMKSPFRLSFDFGGINVLCAPLHSGNNSLAVGGLPASTLVDDFAGLTSPDQGLPDEDLFRIHPYVDASDPGFVEVVLRETGSILFAHGIHPTTHDFWQLNTEADNKDLDKQTEPSVKGTFVDNRISIVENSGPAWDPNPEVDDILSLDKDGLSGSITIDNTVGQPFALAFGPGGYAFVVGLLTDNVLVLDEDGDFVMEWDLQLAGDTGRKIPRGVVIHPTNGNVLVYCWGVNEVRMYKVSTSAHTATWVRTYDLGYDPTPADVAAGRDVFFDATHSLERNLSCASCHVDGGNDFLVWNLSNGPLEEKGPMFTQTLVGLERLAPFHWRGERQLSDFKPAFIGLLGAEPDDGDPVADPGEEPSATAFARFEDFIFSLVNPANPNQNRERVIDTSIQHPDTTFGTEDGLPHDSSLDGDPITGQARFQDPNQVNVARHSCVDCHGFPTGTNNDINVEGEGATRPRRASMKPTPFHEGWRKRQSLVEVRKGPTVIHPAYLGSGFAHIGNQADLFRFVSLVTDPTGIDVDQQANDITDFIHQWDQGLGLAVHFAYLLDSTSSPATIATELTGYLHGEMQKGNCDIAVIGTTYASSTLKLRRWTWDRTAAAYVCEEPALGTRQLSAFVSGVANGEANIFLGLPRGMAERFAVDYDMDGVRNLDPSETGVYDPAVPGTGNGQPPGYAAGGAPEIVWASTKVARLVFTTNEPTTATITYDEPKTPEHVIESPLLSRHHSVLLTGLRPSTSSLDANQLGGIDTIYDDELVRYTVTIELEDATGVDFADPTSYVFATEEFIVPAGLELGQPANEDEESAEKKNQRTHVVQEICMGNAPGCDELTFEASKWRADVHLTIAYKRGKWVAGAGGFERVRVANRAVFGRVLIERADGKVETATDAGLRVIPIGGTAMMVDFVNIDRAPITIGAAGDQGLDGVPEPAGQFVAGLIPTDSNGETTISFYVNPNSLNQPPTDLASGDRVIFNVEGVVELAVDDPAGSAGYIDTTTADSISYGVRWRGGLNQWSFPDTMEARADVRSAPLQP